MCTFVGDALTFLMIARIPVQGSNIFLGITVSLLGSLSSDVPIFTYFCVVSYRWAELTRKLEFHVEVQELNESGEYAPVEVQPRSTVGTGGIFQLRQGQQRRIKVFVKPVQNSGMLPIICESVVSF